MILFFRYLGSSYLPTAANSCTDQRSVIWHIHKCSSGAFMSNTDRLLTFVKHSDKLHTFSDKLFLRILQKCIIFVP